LAKGIEQIRQEIMSFFERLKTEASADWLAYIGHPFTAGLADGTLPETAFRHYLVQDYLFLIEFARAYALAVYKSPQLADNHLPRNEIARVWKRFGSHFPSAT
jgi:thiaminase/transcriptional activator TenA